MAVFCRACLFNNFGRSFQYISIYISLPHPKIFIIIEQQFYNHTSACWPNSTTALLCGDQTCGTSAADRDWVEND